jgi:NAD(P)-dependent dehydrogenase (short-subunit alcohol dehydrogenase family)
MNKKLFDLTGRTALVTGASRSLGRSFTYALAGADIVATARDINRLKQFALKLRHLAERYCRWPWMTASLA